MGGIGAFAVRQWQFTLVVFAMLAAMGVSALLTIPRAEDPNFPTPIISIVAVMPGADPLDMEKLVTDPIEDAVAGLDDIDKIESKSRDGVANIVVHFTWGVDTERKYDQVVREVNAIRGTLPDGLVRLDLKKIETSMTNFVQIALVSDTAPMRELEERGRVLKDMLDRVDGVRETELWGEPRTEVRVAVDLGRLASLGIPVSAVADALQAEGLSIPIGAVHAGARRFNVKATGDFKTLEDVADTVITSHDGTVVKVSDVATVSWSADEPTHIARYNGHPAVFITANQKDGQNVFKMRDAIYALLDDFEKDLPANIKLERGFDQSVSVAHRLSNLFRDFAIALGLVLITLLPLGFRASIVVMLSIPLSLAIGVSALQFSDFSLNQLSIAGFVLALGLLVDDSIVVTENIARHLREGMHRTDAAIAGTRQIAVAVLGCTATLMLAFVPLLFLPEGAGKFIRSLPVSVLYTIAASLFVSLTIIPFLASRILSRHENPEGNLLLRGIMKGIHTIYRPLLHVALGRPLITCLIALGLFVGSVMLVPRIGFSLFPPADSRQFVIDVDLPDGSPLAETDAAVRFVEQEVEKTEGIRWVMSNAGHGNPRIYYNVIPRDEDPTHGAVFAELDHWDSATSFAVIDELRARIDRYPGAQMVVRIFQNGPPIEAPIAMRVTGPNLDVLKVLAADITRVIEETPGARDVVNPLRLDRTDLNLGIDTGKAGLLGVPAGAIDRVVRLALSGEQVASFREDDGDEYPVVVRAPLNLRHDLDALGAIYVPTATGATPLASVTDPRFEAGPARIDRFDRERSATITAFTMTGFNTERVTAEVLKGLRQVQLPPGYRLEVGGETEARQKSFAGLSDAILVAVFGILAVLILEFRSFSSSAVVAGVIPLGIVGGLVALYVTGYTLSFTAIVGFIALIGIEIKNSILLVDFTTQLRRQGVGLKEAIERAGEIRFLPVLLTSMTAIGGLMPLAVENSGLYSPLAIAIIGGLISSTFLSRLVTPAMYLLLAPKTMPADEMEPGAAHTAPGE